MGSSACPKRFDQEQTAPSVDYASFRTLGNNRETAMWASWPGKNATQMLPSAGALCVGFPGAASVRWMPRPSQMRADALLVNSPYARNMQGYPNFNASDAAFIIDGISDFFLKTIWSHQPRGAVGEHDHVLRGSSNRSLICPGEVNLRQFPGKRCFRASSTVTLPL